MAARRIAREEDKHGQTAIVLEALTSVWHLYLIECADGSLYTGVTTDVERRFAEHVSGKGARYTRSRLPVVLVASRPVGSQSQALRAEFAIKQLPRQEKIEAVRSLTLEDVNGAAI